MSRFQNLTAIGNMSFLDWDDENINSNDESKEQSSVKNQVLPEQVQSRTKVLPEKPKEPRSCCGANCDALCSYISDEDDWYDYDPLSDEGDVWDESDYSDDDLDFDITTSDYYKMYLKPRIDTFETGEYKGDWSEYNGPSIVKWTKTPVEEGKIEISFYLDYHNQEREWIVVDGTMLWHKEKNLYSELNFKIMRQDDTSEFFPYLFRISPKELSSGALTKAARKN